MKGLASTKAIAVAALVMLAAGCASPEHRMNVAANRDDVRRSEFEHCRNQGRTDCDAILNAPVDSSAPRGDSVRDQERREAYDRCVDRGGTDCSDLLRR